jgi:hypothetical protein
MFVFGEYLNQVSWEEEKCENKVAIALFLKGNDYPPKRLSD